MSQATSPFAAPIQPVLPLQSTPVAVPTAGSQQEALAQQAKVTGFKNSVTGLFDSSLWAAAYDNDVVSYAVRQVARSGFDPQPGFSLTPGRLADLSKDIDPEYHAMFGEAVSDIHAQAIRNQGLQLTESKRKLMQAGHAGLFASITAAIVNPTNLASMGAGYVVGAARGGATATQATRASRIYEAARMGFANAAVSAPVNAYRASQDANYRGVDAAIDTATDVAFGAVGPYIGESSAFTRFAVGGSVAAGVPFVGYSLTPEQEMQESTAMLLLQFGIGGGLSAAFGRTRVDDGYESAAGSVDRRTTAMAVDEAGGLSDAGKAHFADVFGPEHDDNLMASVARATGLDDDEANAVVAKIDTAYEERPVKTVSAVESASAAATPAIDPEVPTYRFDYNTSPDSIRSRNFYHGTGTVGLTPDTVDPTITSHEGLYGPGFYLTDNPSIADGYAKARGKNTGKQQVYEANIDNANLLDLESNTGKQVFDAAMQSFQPYQDLRDSFAKAASNAESLTGAEVYRILRQEVTSHSRQNEIPTSEYVEDFSLLNEYLYRQGFDGFTHVGGKNTGNDPHQVVILFDPARNLFDNPDNKPPILRALNPTRQQTEAQRPRQVAMGAAGQYGIRLTTPAPAPAHGILGGFDASSIDDRSAWGVLSKDLGGKVTVSPSRWTMFDLTSQTPVDEHRVLANGLMTHTLLRRGEIAGSKTMAHISGVEQVERAMRERWTPIQQDVRAAWAEFLTDAKKNGQVNVGSRFINLRDANGNISIKKAMDADPGTFSYTGFQQQVGREARRIIEGLPATNQYARKAAMRYIDFARDIGEFAKAHGVRGAENLDTTMPYMPRAWSREALDNAALEHGQDAVVRTLADAILPRLNNQASAGVPLPPATMDQLAMAMGKAVYNNAGTMRSPHGLIPLTRTDFDRIVRDIIPNISDTDLNTLRAQLTPPDDSDILSMLRSRIPMDELYVANMPNGKQLAIEDLLISDAQSLYHGYARKMMGGSMIAELERVMRHKFSDDAIDLQNLNEFRAFIRKAAEREGVENEGNLARLEAAYRAVSGLPMQDVDTAGKALYHSAARTIMSLNFMRSLSGLVSGIANIGDVVRAIATPEAGLRATFKAFPAMRDLVDATIKGEPPKGIIAAAYRAGLATGRVTGSSSLRDPNLGEMQGTLQKVEYAARFGARAGAYTSLQQPVTDMGDAILYAGFVQRLHDDAPSLSENRILALGIDPGEYTEIANKIRQHAIKDPSGVVIDPNEGNWGDPALATKFRNASNRFVRRATNQGDSTMMTRWLGNTIEGKILGQFRTYAFRGMETQLLFNLQMGDPAGYISFLTGSASATMMYVAGVWVNSLGRPDAEEYRARMLSDQSIAKAAVGRAAWAGLLPMFVDTAIALGDGTPVFAQQRISGLGTDNGIRGLWLGNPTFDWGDNVLGSFSILRAPFDPDYNFSQRNAKTLQNALWVPNAANFRNFLNAALSDLPERSENE